MWRQRAPGSSGAVAGLRLSQSPRQGEHSPHHGLVQHALRDTDRDIGGGVIRARNTRCSSHVPHRDWTKKRDVAGGGGVLSQQNVASSTLSKLPLHENGPEAHTLVGPEQHQTLCLWAHVYVHMHLHTHTRV